MPHPKGWDLPAPEHDQEFETLCLDLMSARLHPMVEPVLYGRSGQLQHGVDFAVEVADGLRAFQCKRVARLTFDEVAEEVRKLARFPNRPCAFTVLTTAPNDARLLDEVMALSQTRRDQGLCAVSVVAWTMLRDWVVEYPAVLAAHYPELAPSLDDLRQGQARRLDEEFPGTTLDVHTEPGRTEVVINPGPGGFPFSTTFVGRDVFERLQTATKMGEAVTFEAHEFEMQMPDVLGMSAASGFVSTRLKIAPALNGTRFAAEVFVEPRTRYHTIEIFRRKASRESDPLRATATISNFGTEIKRLALTFDTLPLSLSIEVHGRGGYVRVDRNYEGVSVQRVLAAERMYAKMSSAYHCIVGGGRTVSWDTGEGFEAGPFHIELFERLVELSRLSGWDIDIPLTFTPQDLADVESLLHFFQTGRRVVGLGATGTLRLRPDTAEGCMGLRALLDHGVEPFSARVAALPGPITFLGAEREFPETDIHLLKVEIREEEVAENMPDGSISARVRITTETEVLQVRRPSGPTALLPSE